ncbi:MAG: hypothetical protein V3V00_00075 [Saprospiraceae bacterium]
MRKVDLDMLYDTDLNTWVKISGETVIIGITDWTQNIIGNVKFIYLSSLINDMIIRNMLLCELESDKATTEITSPISGVLINFNPLIFDSPSLINKECYTSGWIVKLKLIENSQLDQLLPAEKYKEAIDSFFKKS